MKTLIAFLAAAAIATPGRSAWACPNMDHDDAPKTTIADKDKAKDQKPADTAKAKDADKAKDAPKPADTAKAKEPAKKPDKVSSK